MSVDAGPEQLWHSLREDGLVATLERVANTPGRGWGEGGSDASAAFTEPTRPLGDPTSSNYDEGVTQHFFSRMMERIRIPREEFTFVDIGSGKGKALMLAADHGFREIVGIEFSPSLHATAAANLQAFRVVTETPVDFTLHCMDAREYEFSDSDIVVFLYNPFHGTAMSEFVAKLDAFIKERRRRVVVAYRTPESAESFEQSDTLNIMGANPDFVIYANARRARN